MKHVRWIILTLAFFFAGKFLVPAYSQPERLAATPLRFNEILWREVQDREGRTLGSVSDILVQMPSGRIVFVAVTPPEFYAHPKAVSTNALSLPSKDGALRLDLTTDGWIDAPQLDLESALVIKATSAGGKISGYYQQEWREPELTPAGVPVVVTAPKDAPAANRYVSLGKLLWNRVTTPAWQQDGYVRDFLLNWPEARVTHAIVSSRFTPVAPKDTTWFAVPVTLLNPPVQQSAITINSGIESLRSAPDLPAASPARISDTQIYRYPARSS